MTAGSPPDWAALYDRYRDVLWRVAATKLRVAGLSDDAGDVVQDALLSLMASPPARVDNWEALLVRTVQRRAIDHMKSAAVKHAGPELDDAVDQASDEDIATEVGEAIDRSRSAAKAWDALARLDGRLRKVAWEVVALERPRAAVALELGVSPARISQMRKQALEQLRAALTEGEVKR